MRDNHLLWFLLIIVILLLIGCSVFQPGRQVQPPPNSPAEKITPLDSSSQATALPLPSLPTDSAGSYQNPDFTFKPPARWVVHEGPTATGKTAWNYANLNLKIIVEVRSKEFLPMVTIASRDLPPGSSLEPEFNTTYAAATPAITEIETKNASVDGLSALVKKYKRPWGEPWYAFQDAWVQKGQRIFVISCQNRLNPDPDDLRGCEEILSSLHFK